MSEYKKSRPRIVICSGCKEDGDVEGMERLLIEKLGERAPAYRMKGAVIWEVASCLDMCGEGPNCMIYPEGTRYNHLDVTTFESILDELIEQATQEHNEL